MLKMKQWRLLLIILLIICVFIALFFTYYKRSSPITKPQDTKSQQLQKFPKNSPESITQTYYLSYEACLQQHTKDLKMVKIQKDCPLHAFPGMAKTFVQENQVTYEDQIFCDEGIPVKMNIGKSYIDEYHDSTVNVTINTKYDQFVIPVRLQKESGSWKIYRVDCDLDGSLE